MSVCTYVCVFHMPKYSTNLQFVGENIEHCIPSNLKEQEQVIHEGIPLSLIYYYLYTQVCKIQTVRPFSKPDVHLSIELSVGKNLKPYTSCLATNWASACTLTFIYINLAFLAAGHSKIWQDLTCVW